MADDRTLIGICLSVIISLCYCYYISSRVPKGKLRFISLLPIFYLFTILPLYLYSAIATAITFFLITWLANFKLLLFCFDRGPFSSGPPKSLLLFITIVALPYKIKENINHPVVFTKPKRIPLNLPMKILLLAVAVPLLHNIRQANYIHPKIVLVLYSFLLYILIDVIVAPANLLVSALLGLELDQPTSDEPYLSTSLQDFWGCRWNLMATNILRHTVYLPLKSSSTAFIGKDMASLVSVFASFVVSALMHELLEYQLFPDAPSTWEMGSFFLVHGICVVVELILKTVFADRWRLPPVVSWLLTLGFLAVTGFWLFFPPIISSGLDVKVIDEGMLILEYMKSKLEEMYLFIQRWNGTAHREN